MRNCKRILLTGGSGFIGKNLLKQIGIQHEVVAPTHRDLDLLNAKAAKIFLNNRKFDLVIHAANFGGSRAQVGFTDVLGVNKKMFLNLAENGSLFGRMIFLGSGAEYGKQRPIVKIKESEFGQIKPGDEYGLAKYFASEYIEAADNIINLRLFGVFGKYEDYRIRFISNAICHAILGLPIIINQNVIFDYLYVNDLAKIISYFIDNQPKEKFYNSGTGRPVDLFTIAQIVNKVSEKNLEIQIKNHGLNREYTCDNSRLLGEIPGLVFSPLEQSVRELYGWYNENAGRLNKEILATQI